MNKAGWGPENNHEWDQLHQKINGLEAALFIARDAERVAKERISAVSEELVAAHQENDIWRRLISLPVATGEDLVGGWTIDPDFLDKISDDMSEPIGLEEIEDVLLTFNKLKSAEMLAGGEK